jgi:hypothetical protein
MTQRKVDKEKLERADREARRLIEAERESRQAKTARLKRERLAKKEGETGT